MSEPARGSEAWDELVSAHLAFASRIYSPEELARVSRESGLTVGEGGRNTAASYDDVARYLSAVAKVLGETAFVSAKLTVMNKARTLGLRPPGLRWFV
ncbi:MAG: hypothetical protein L6Q84_22045 [Polyangiaceae bacterium]|nr:hypothetical protein [Polyangiaceae bacterium]